MSGNTDASKKSIWDGLVKERPGGWVAGDGYLPGDDPLLEKRNKAQDSGSDSDTGKSHKSKSTFMSRDRYEPSQYGERGYAAADGYARDSRSDAYEAQYGSNRGYSRDPPQYVKVDEYRSGPKQYTDRRSYDDQDMDDYYEKTKVTKYTRYPDESRTLAPYADDRQRARSQDVYSRREEKRSRSRGRRGSGSSSGSERESSNTPLKKWAATFAGAAAGGAVANRVSGSHRHEGHDNNWVPTAIGAVVGGLLAREVEKKLYEHKDERRKREKEEGW